MAKQSLIRDQAAKHPFLHHKELANVGEEKRTDPIYCKDEHQPVWLDASAMEGQVSKCCS